ncbi:Oxo-4-hydroxy-4-carboxy-5-ureidoimidazoline decarboxylase [Lentinula aciculospora]|uniref:Oxo-4-hydroxy-4-carboxy-5-ureidoimidazoline decarboxylase n=1 Tax=Lentinula aciculospora TaxID=153920 RepID=A0A9W9A3F4_9AGAR|nr:Oxo-4-hydroxy-4-carboxy-5-ureidoimidazoline decarboxylase [Lentinula aciculospora]
MEPLPSLDWIRSSSNAQPDSPLAVILGSLLEPSTVLIQTLVPQLHDKLQNYPSSLNTYAQLIDLAINQVRTWDKDLQAQFILGHPRIGETKNLSTFSANEQGAAHPTATPTPPAVLARLAHLNAYYERCYPQLVYIIFVDGRSRAQIVRVLEDHLGLEPSLSIDNPPLEAATIVEVGSQKWLNELERAVTDIGLIAKSRLRSLGAE